MTEFGQTLLTFHEQTKVGNNCNAYRVPSRLTVSAEQKNNASQLIQHDNTGYWDALEQGSPNFAVLSAHLKYQDFFAGACR
jgi:hypothetical protein